MDAYEQRATHSRTDDTPHTPEAEHAARRGGEGHGGRPPSRHSRSEATRIAMAEADLAAVDNTNLTNASRATLVHLVQQLRGGLSDMISLVRAHTCDDTCR